MLFVGYFFSTNSTDWLQKMMAFKINLETDRDRWIETQPRPALGDIYPLTETVPLE